MSINSANPSILFGGIWAPIEGKFLIGADTTYTAGNTGGKSSYVAADMPAHTHTRGTMEITGTIKGRPHYTNGDFPGALVGASGAFTHTKKGDSGTNTGTSEYNSTSSVKNDLVTFNASNAWTGETS